MCFLSSGSRSGSTPGRRGQPRLQQQQCMAGRQSVQLQPRLTAARWAKAGWNTGKQQQQQQQQEQQVACHLRLLTKNKAAAHLLLPLLSSTINSASVLSAMPRWFSSSAARQAKQRNSVCALQG